jgi:hypothetical protein
VKCFDLTGKVNTKGELEKLFGEIGLPPPQKPTTKKKGEVEISVAVVKTNSLKTPSFYRETGTITHHYPLSCVMY